MSTEIKVLDIFQQDSQPECGIPAHWCVQYKKEQSGFPMYEYFSTYLEAVEWAMSNGYYYE